MIFERNGFRFERHVIWKIGALCVCVCWSCWSRVSKWKWWFSLIKSAALYGVWTIFSINFHVFFFSFPLVVTYKTNVNERMWMEIWESTLWFWDISFDLHPLVSLNGLSVLCLILWILLRIYLFGSVDGATMNAIRASTQRRLILNAGHLADADLMSIYRIFEISCRMVRMARLMLCLPNGWMLLRM